MLSINRVGVRSSALLLLITSYSLGQAPFSVEWVRQYGTESHDFGAEVAVDALGNAYVAGSTGGDLAGSAGLDDAYLAKFNADGFRLWTVQLGTSDFDNSFALAVDATGHAFLAGATRGDLGSENAGSSDAFVTKLDPSGETVWTRQLGTVSHDSSSSIVVDPSGDVYVAGTTRGSFEGAHAGSSDAFLVKLNSSGTEVWRKQIGTSSSDAISSLALDASSNLYASGRTSGDLLDGNKGSSDIFVVKYSPDGEELWGRQIGTSAADESNSITVDVAGNAFLTGFTKGSLGGTNAGNNDAVLIKLDAHGNTAWSHQFGTDDSDVGFSVTADSYGGVFLGGGTFGDLEEESQGSFDGFVTKLSSTGAEVWTHQYGTSGSETSASVTLDQSGDLFISGSTTGDLVEGASEGSDDTFLIKLSLPQVDLPGDYNDDGTVNSADFTVWRDNLGEDPGALPNDRDGVVVGPAQYATWISQFGIVAATEPAESLPVPEPASLVLVSSFVLLSLRRGRDALAGAPGAIVARANKGTREWHTTP